MKGVKEEKLFWCKHLIAAKLSNAMNCCQIIEISDQQMTKMLINNIFNH
jgi:hypothetical protein